MNHWSGYRRIGRPLFILTAIAISGCRNETTSEQPAADGRIPVYVSIPPQKFLAEQIGGKHVRVDVLLKAGQSAHTYEPTPKQMVELSASKVFFRIGAPFETQIVDKIGQALKGLLIVDMNKGIALREQTEACSEHESAEEHAHHHDHKASSEPDHSEMDMHTWMNPRLAKAQASTVCSTLCQVDPVHQADYEANLGILREQLDRLDAEIAESLKPLKGRAFFVFHPAFGYFADAYGLRQVAIETGGKQPMAKQLATLIDRAKAENVKLIFIQPQFSRRGAEAVAQAIGGAVVPLDDLAENYVENLRHVAAEVKRALAPASAPATSRSS